MRPGVLVALILICAGLPSGGLTQSTSTSKPYVVKRGDTLLTMAEELRPPGATLNQMGLALVKTNLRAFQSRTTLQLPAGTNLTIPPAAVVLGTDAATAETEFSRVWRGDQHYRAALALEKSKDQFYAFVSYVEAAKLGHGRAQLRLAQLYDNDLSGFVQHDLLESAQWYDKARRNQVEFAKQQGRPMTLQGGI